MASAALAMAGRGVDIPARFADQPAASTVAAMLERGFNAPETSSAGRWFDAAAGLLDVQRVMRFEGQAAMLLEGLAERHGPVAPDASLYALTDDGMLDLLPLALRLADCGEAGYGAALFHATLVGALAQWVEAAARASGVTTVACGGGCFLNALLATGLRAALRTHGITMLEARAAPPNDGGLALGQAYVTQHALRAGLL
jgi:hydrogenase maturation protein HypF